MTVKTLRFFTVSPFFTEKLIEALLSTASAYTRERAMLRACSGCFRATW